MPARRLDLALSTLDAFARLRDLPHAVLLQSADPSHAHGAVDVIVADPWRTVRYADGELTVGTERVRTNAPVPTLKAWLAPLPFAPTFRSGFVGAFGYGLGLDAHRRPDPPPASIPFPDLVGGFYGWSLTFDHRRSEVRLAWRPGTPASVLAAVCERLDRPPRRAEPFEVSGPFTTELDSAAYASAFTRVKDYLFAGDCYQVNLARHFSAPFIGCSRDAAWTLYRRAVRLQGGPFSAFMETPEGAIVCLSPERLLRFTPREAVTMPIKGTAPRSADPVRDAALGRALRVSAKDRAENLMIVDLMRNDLGRFCLPGTIAVPQLFELQQFPNVSHLVSTIRGQPRPDVHALDALAQVLPAGSITGCPKQRATEIIDELEPVSRSVYCGAIGYVDDGGLMDTNVAIRTLVFTNGRVHCWGGGGVVADSEVGAEAREIEHKVGRLLQAARALSSRSPTSVA
jgi:para-aminobenzoate synthetase component 1